MLEIRELFAWYGVIEALHGVSLAVQAGERVAIIGPNRAGKTTILRAISGLVRRQGARLHFDGRDLSALAPHLIPALGIAHVPEGRQVFAGMSVEDNLLAGAHAAPWGSAQRRRRLDEVFALFARLKERRRQASETLSGGEQQMLAIGRALMLGPRLLMLDEPSQGLAPRAIGELYQGLDTIAAQGTTAILLVEQSAARALEFASRAYVIENGIVALEGPSARLARDEAVRASYLGI
jgi:branched-chain amino acid transport system ATP-binding protein